MRNLIIISVLLFAGCKKDETQPLKSNYVSPFQEVIVLVDGKHIIDGDTYQYKDGSVMNIGFLATAPSYRQKGYDEYHLHTSRYPDFSDTVKQLTTLGYCKILHETKDRMLVYPTSKLTKDLISEQPYYWRIVDMDRMLSTKPLKYYIR